MMLWACSVSAPLTSPQVERKENEGRRRAQQHFVENGGIDLPAGEKAAGHEEERRCQRNDERRRTELREIIATDDNGSNGAEHEEGDSEAGQRAQGHRRRQHIGKSRRSHQQALGGTLPALFFPINGRRATLQGPWRLLPFPALRRLRRRQRQKHEGQHGQKRGEHTGQGVVALDEEPASQCRHDDAAAGENDDAARANMREGVEPRHDEQDGEPTRKCHACHKSARYGGQGRIGTRKGPQARKKSRPGHKRRASRKRQVLPEEKQACQAHNEPGHHGQKRLQREARRRGPRHIEHHNAPGADASVAHRKADMLRTYPYGVAFGHDPPFRGIMAQERPPGRGPVEIPGTNGHSTLTDDTPPGVLPLIQP